jgi:hypothetical protein
MVWLVFAFIALYVSGSVIYDLYSATDYMQRCNIEYYSGP